MLAQMLDEAERVYRTFLTRVVRRPLSPSSAGELPIVVVAPDLPVGRRGKAVAGVAINDGMHLHGVLLVPSRSRLPLPADEHFRREQAQYARDRSRLDVVDVRPIDRGECRRLCAEERAPRPLRLG